MKTWMFIYLLTLVGCVGTIEDPKKIDKSTIQNQVLDFNFNGASSARAISHRGFQVSFEPASGGSGIFDYNLYVDGNFTQSAASLASENAGIDTNGKLNIMINNLNFRTVPYSLVVRARNRVSLLEDYNTNAIVLPVLGYETPLFNGAIKLENVQGSLGKSALTVTWAPAGAARPRANAFAPTTVYDITGYSIYYQKQGLGAISSVLIANPNATSYTLTGLEENTFYHVWVSAKDGQNPAVEDENLVTLAKSTYPDRPILFNGINTAYVPNNANGLSNLIASWSPASGNFTKYRIFFTTNTSTTSINPPVDSITMSYVDVAVSANNPNVSSYQFPVNFPNTTYRVFVVACDDTCGDYQGEDTYQDAATTPPVAPFAGAELAEFGVDAVELSWIYGANENLGATDGFRVTMKQCLPPMLCAESILTNLSPTEKLFSTPTKSSKKIKVIGLTEGANYCFKVESSLTAGAPTKVYENTAWKCGVPQYQQPGPATYLSETYLLSPGPGTGTRYCQSPTTDGFTVKWKGPSSGTFSRYEILLQEGVGPLDWNNAVTVNLQGNHDANTQYSKTITGKIAGTQVQVAVRTVYEDVGNNLFYGQIASSFSCTIEIQKAVPQGWTSIMAIGLKDDVIDGNVPESFSNKNDIFATRQEIDDAGLPFKVSSRGVDDNSIKPDFSFPAEYSLLKKNYTGATLSSTKTSIGGRMVRLAWKDFIFQDNSLFSAGDLSGTVGYKIFRMPYSNSHSTTPPVATTAGWVDVTGGPVVKANLISFNDPNRNFYQAEFVDYTIPSPISADDAQVYWYKVEPYIGATKVDLLSTPGDYILKIVTPPSNTAMAHRWMLNKESCERLGKVPDRNNQYRCAYTGIGSRRFAPAGALYLDFRGHLLIDRFELGCNFSRALLTCHNGASVGTHETRASLACDTLNDPGCAAESLLTAIQRTGVEDGACINMHSLPNTAADGSVFYNRATKKGGSWYWTAVVPNDSCFYRDGGAWKTIEQAITTAGGNLSVVAGTAISNKAGLPPLTMISQGNMSKICGTFSVNLKSPSDGLIKTLSKRLPRKQEYVALMADPIEVENYSNHYEAAIGSRHNMGCNTKHGYAAGGDTRPVGGLANHELNFSKASNGDYGQRKNELNLNHFRYPRTTAWETTGLDVAGTGPVFATGSQGLNSSAACTFNYGVQDIMGNVPEWSGEKFICSTVEDCYPSSYTQDPNIISEALTLGGDVTKTLNFTTSVGPNRTGFYLYSAAAGVNGATQTLLNTHIYGNGYYTQYALHWNYGSTGSGVANSRNVFTTAPFFSKFTGVPLFCQDPNHCDGDSMKFTLAAPSLGWNTTGATTITAASIGNDLGRIDLQAPQTDLNAYASIGLSILNMASINGQTAGYVVGGFPCNSQNRSDATYGITYRNPQSCEPNINAQGRYSYTLTESNLKYPDVGGRCAAMVEEDEGGSFVP